MIEHIGSEPSTLTIIQNPKHPHYGESGWLDESGTEAEAKIESTGQIYFKLSNCEHGKNGCYVTPEDIAQTKAAAVEGEVMPTPATPGRPAEYGDEVVGKLEWAFEQGYNVTEACFYAGIHRDTYYDWMQKHDGFSDKMEWAKQALARKAKDTVRNAIKAGDQNTARWYLDRRDPDFKPKSEITPVGAEVQKTRDKIKDFLNEPDDASAESAGAIESGDVESLEEPTPDIS